MLAAASLAWAGNVTCGFDDASLSPYLPRTRRLSVVSALDTYYGNPRELANETAGVHAEQRVFSGYDCATDNDDGNCLHADGSGYYVVPPGEIAAVPGFSGHSSTFFAFFQADGDAVWQATAVFDWMVARGGWLEAGAVADGGAAARPGASVVAVVLAARALRW